MCRKIGKLTNLIFFWHLDTPWITQIALPCEFRCDPRDEGDFVGVAVVVVQGKEPVARRQEVARRLGHRRLEERFN